MKSGHQSMSRMKVLSIYRFRSVILFLLIGISFQVKAQVYSDSTYQDSTAYAKLAMKEQAKKWGPNDTVIVPAIYYHNEIVNYKEMDMVWISKLSPDKLAKYIEEWTRLRNAVYVTYPYAKIAGTTINDINKNLENVDTKIERKAYIKTREKELRKEFSDPLTNLSVYQGKILMKLINRQTGNNCYDIIKEYKGGLNARIYQTVAWFIGGSLKQDWNISENKMDRQIENFVKEIDGVWYKNPYRN
jgi:hypothetical protein